MSANVQRTAPRSREMRTRTQIFGHRQMTSIDAFWWILAGHPGTYTFRFQVSESAFSIAIRVQNVRNINVVATPGMLPAGSELPVWWGTGAHIPKRVFTPLRKRPVPAQSPSELRLHSLLLSAQAVFYTI